MRWIKCHFGEIETLVNLDNVENITEKGYKNGKTTTIIAFNGSEQDWIEVDDKYCDILDCINAFNVIYEV